VAGNALLRYQLTILQRQVKRSALTRTDRVLLVLLARLVRALKQALYIVQPETLLRWHWKLFRLSWKRKSKSSSYQPKVAADTNALIRAMAKDKRLWGAERIRGELLKLGLLVCKRTVQKYMRTVRTHQPRGQSWATDLAQPRRTGLGMRRAFRSLICSFDCSQAFYLIELQSRKVIHIGVHTSCSNAMKWDSPAVLETRNIRAIL
jgi:hypothetical protein